MPVLGQKQVVRFGARALAVVFLSLCACRHRHGGVSSKDMPPPVEVASSSAEATRESKSAEAEVAVKPAESKAENTAAESAAPKVEPARTHDDVVRLARKAGAPEKIVIPKDVAGTYAGHKHRSGKERLEGETCTITADKQVSLSILEDGTARWSGITLLDLRCPGDEKDKPTPLHCWYEGQGVIWKGASNKYEIRATLGKRGATAASAAFRSYKCKAGEVAVDRRWSVSLPSDCVAVDGASSGSGSGEGSNCSWSNEFKQLQEGALSAIGSGRFEVPILMAGPSSMTLDRISEVPAN